MDFLLHLDTHLAQAVQTHGPWVYGLLGLLVFCETGLVVMPFLPGDTLLFAAGLLAGQGMLNPWLVAVMLIVASVAGDNTNFWVGQWLGKRLFREKGRWLKREHLEKTRAFYERHGRRTIILGKFVPFVRTLAPFVAGMDAMPYRRFWPVTIVAAVSWVGICVGAGYFLGEVPFVREHFGEIVLGICVLSVVMIAIEARRARPEPA